MPRVLSASTLTGNEVVNSTGESLGKIEDVMLDTREGKVSYAVLSFGGFMGMGDKLFAIPWQKLQLDEREERFLLDVPRETLEQAPGFDKDNWPDFADPSVGTGIDTYYGTGPR